MEAAAAESEETTYGEINGFSTTASTKIVAKSRKAPIGVDIPAALLESHIKTFCLKFVCYVAF